MNSQVLKPCPFCGGKAEKCDAEWIGCADPHCPAFNLIGTESEWNTRAALPAVEAAEIEVAARDLFERMGCVADDEKCIQMLVIALRDGGGVEDSEIERYTPISQGEHIPHMNPCASGKWMTVAQHRRILAGVNPQAGSGMPEGWRFSAADFSCMAAGNNTKGYVSLVRDPESRKAWHSMTDELKDADDGPELYVSGYGYTLAEAFADAANKANAAAPLPPSPAAKAAPNE